MDLFTLWKIFEAAIANLMLNSEPVDALEKRHHFFDGRSMPLNIDGMMQFYGSFPALLDLHGFAKQLRLSSFKKSSLESHYLFATKSPLYECHFRRQC